MDSWRKPLKPAFIPSLTSFFASYNKLLLTYPSEISLEGRLAKASLDGNVVLGARRDVDLRLDQGSNQGVLRVQVAQI